jgi:DNA-binding winged helix-turn-helix (wHTH) protein/TolB-like protein/lipopolysaccharide biosynthesis regulator YciM
MDQDDRHCYDFGPFHLEPAEQLLLREDNPVALTPKNFELLVFLVRNHGRLVTKQQIMQAVWPSSFVEEANLTVSISGLRRKLGERGGGLQYIETVPKKGYRFTAAVTEVKSAVAIPANEDALPADIRRLETTEPLDRGADDEAAPAAPSALPLLNSSGSDNAGETVAPIVLGVTASKRPSLRVMMSVLAVLIGLLAVIVYVAHPGRSTAGRPVAENTSQASRSLAILPLQNLRQDANNDFLGFSLADAVITKLGSVSALSVRPSSVIQKYKDQTIDIARVAVELNVDTLLTGNFLRDGDDLRITYQLIDVRANRIVAKDVINIRYDNLISVHDTVARQIVQALELKLTSSEAERIKSDEPVDPLAYEYYLRGVDLMGSHQFPLAIRMLEKSAAIDGRHALTWAYLGQSYNSAAAFAFGGREQYRRAQDAYQRALALQPSQLEAHVFLANLLIDTGRVEQAVPLLRNALKSAPNSAAVHWELGYAYRFAGMLNESVAECALARRIDPLVQANGSVLNAYLYLGEYDKFLHSLPKGDDSGFIVFYRGLAEYLRKNVDQAARDFDRAYELDPSLYTQIGKALSHSIAHHDAEGLRILNQLENRIQQNGVGDAEASYKIAQAYAVLGDRASALRMFRYSIENGFFAHPYFLFDPLLENVRGEPQFQPLMESARRRHEAFKSQFF